MKRYKIRQGSVADYAIRIGKPLGVLVVAGLILAAYSWAAADELETYRAQEAEIADLRQELAKSEQVVVNEEKDAKTSENRAYLGTYKTTAYCGCSECCGKWADEEATTASGEKAVQGVTVAADTDVLPFGTQLEIDGKVYTVQDTGSAVTGNTIDIYFENHADAVAYGVQEKEVMKCI